MALPDERISRIGGLMSKSVKTILTCFLLGLMGLAFTGVMGALVFQNSEAFLACSAVAWLSGLLVIALFAVTMED